LPAKAGAKVERWAETEKPWGSPESRGIIINLMKKIKLNQLALEKLQNQEMKMLNGGYSLVCHDDGLCCGCGCYYANSGGSSATDNQNANSAGRLMSPYK
jgi:natural product precursor